MAADADLIALVRAIGAGEHARATQLLHDRPELATATLRRSHEFFLETCRAQLYEGDTALHAAAFAYDTYLVHRLVESDASVRARNRRGAEPLHSAMMGGPGSPHWNPDRQCEVIECLVEIGADPNARAVGGVTPLHRAVRNRCSSAVEALLRSGADPNLANANGSTPLQLAQWTTGRGGTGSAEARAEQERIVALLANARR